MVSQILQWFSQILLLLVLIYEQDFSPIPHLSRCMSTIAIGSFLIKTRLHLDYNSSKVAFLRGRIYRHSQRSRLHRNWTYVRVSWWIRYATGYRILSADHHNACSEAFKVRSSLTMCFPPRLQESLRLKYCGVKSRSCASLIIRFCYPLHLSMRKLSPEVQRVLWADSIANLNTENIKNIIRPVSNVAILETRIHETIQALITTYSTQDKE